MYAELSIDHGILKDGYELLKISPGRRKMIGLPGGPAAATAQLPRLGCAAIQGATRVSVWRSTRSSDAHRVPSASLLGVFGWCSTFYQWLPGITSGYIGGSRKSACVLPRALGFALKELLAPGASMKAGLWILSRWVVGPNEQAVRIINIMDECSRRRWTEAHSSISAKKLLRCWTK
ncbi:MAG: hypothetical protein IPN20_11665 [Haliscomenobacter sp.]|nr:hypothetical protein [Haliscomenobacter sp.]